MTLIPFGILSVAKGSEHQSGKIIAMQYHSHESLLFCFCRICEVVIHLIGAIWRYQGNVAGPQVWCSWVSTSADPFSQQCNALRWYQVIQPQLCSQFLSNRIARYCQHYLLCLMWRTSSSRLKYLRGPLN